MQLVRPNFRHFFIIFIFLFATVDISAQTEDEMALLEKIVDDYYGVEKLQKLNLLSSYYYHKNDKKAAKYGKQAVALSESIFTEGNPIIDQKSHRKEKLLAHFQLGLIHYDQEKYNRAKENMEIAVTEAQLLEDSIFISQTTYFLEQINSLASEEGFFTRNLKPLNLGGAINSKSENIKINTTLKFARRFEKNENYSKAIEQYQKAINLLRNKGEGKQIAELRAKIADLYKLEGKPEAAIAFYQMATEDFEKLSDTSAVEASQFQLEEIFTDVKSLIPISDTLLELPTEVQGKNTAESIEKYKQLSKEAEAKGNITQSLEYFRRYSELEKQFLARQQQQRIDSINLRTQAQKIQILQQENYLNEIQADLQNEEIEKQEQFRNILIVGAIALFLLSIVFYRLFITKKKAHQELEVTFNQLDATKSKLEKAEQKITKLLGQQVSGDVAQALISNEVEQGSTRKYVCIMFLDIRNFTPFASTKTPEEIIEYQNDVFGFMIEIINKHNGVINQFMGDGFMATFGAPTSYGNDVLNAFNAAQEIIEEVNQKSESGEIFKTRVGIGLHAGNVVTGNVGTELRKQYSITGTTVITAARIEQLNKKYTSQLLVSGEVVNKIDNIVSTQGFESFKEQLKGMDEKMSIFKIA